MVTLVIMVKLEVKTLAVVLGPEPALNMCLRHLRVLHNLRQRGLGISETARS